MQMREPLYSFLNITNKELIYVAVMGGVGGLVIQLPHSAGFGLLSKLVIKVL
uniref:Uncharacterized protein n=1 Tax=Anguilla anguilla TaxID=7936 RepID=A0A0E9PB47_ANGAN